MSGKKYSKVLTILLIIIIIAVIGLLAYLGYNAYKKNKTEQDAEDFVGAFTDSDDSSDGSGSNGTTDNALVNEIESSSTSTEKTYYKGYEVLGTIEIPATDVEYPILATETSRRIRSCSMYEIYDSRSLKYRRKCSYSRAQLP